MESPKFIICPECNERYNDTTKRRLIDTCGHPRCYSCLFKDNPCPVCTKLPQRRERARTLSNEKLLAGINGESGRPRYQRLLSDTAGTFTGMFRKDSYLRTLYSYDPSSKGYNMEEKIRRYKSLEILNDRTRTGSVSSDVSTDVFMSALQDTPEQRSLSSSIDELDEDSPKSSPEPIKDEKQDKLCPKAWPSCPELSIQENIWQMRQPAIETRSRPSSLYQMKYSNNSPRGSVYSPRSSGYWSELEQLSESETFVSPTPKHPAESPSPLPQDKASSEETETPKTTTCHSEAEETGNKFVGAWQKTRGVFQQWQFKANRTRSSECLTRPASDSFRHKTIQRINSMPPVERHTKKISENNTQRKAFMTDV